MLRLLSMLAMLAVLAMLISRAAQPAMWLWLTGESSAQVQRKQDSAGPAEQPPTPEPVTIGTDLDGEEQAEVADQFQALTDFSLGMAREEMPAYWRLFCWTQRQRFEQMRQRAEQKPLFNQFIQDRQQQRGKLFRLDLTVRQVLSYPAATNSASVKEVFEIVGTTEQSQAWYYMVLTSELPLGMPRGKINERATFVGYFLKVQGYQPGGASPNDKPLPAPLLIGRLEWRPAAVARTQSEVDGLWIWWLGGTVALFVFGRAAWWLYRRSRRTDSENVEKKPPLQTPAVRDWLASAEDNPPANSAEGWRGADFQNN